VTRAVFLAAVALLLAAAAGVRAQPSSVSPPPISRTVLQTSQLEGDRHATTVARVVVAKGAGVPRHVHAGVEIGYVIEGAGTLLVDGKAPQALARGDSFKVAEGLAHSLRNPEGEITLLVVYSTETGKPLSTPAP
jgi:quercetin dioxygenase-like cupin family protein